MNKKGLGKGLGALLGEQPGEMDPASVTKLPITKIEPAENQPRKDFDPQALEDLAESIRIHGLLQPLAVRRIAGGCYQIIAGERRWRAARMAGLDELPAIILDVDDRQSMEMALVENLQREDLNPIEEAAGFRRLMDEFGLTQEEMSERVGRSRPAIANSLRLLGLPDSVKALLRDGKLSSGHARALLQIRDHRRIEAAAARIAEEQLSVRQTELLAARLAAVKDKPTPSLDETPVNYLSVLEEELTGQLGRRIRIVKGRKKGRIEMEFYNDEDLNALLEAIRRLKR